MKVPILTENFELDEAETREEFANQIVFYDPKQGKTVYRAHNMGVSHWFNGKQKCAFVRLYTHESLEKNLIEKFLKDRPNIMNFIFAYGTIVEEK